MTWKRRALAPILSIALVFGACGGDGESPEDREAVVQMLERLNKSRILALCIADEWDGLYTAEDLQPMIDARGDFSSVNFDLIEHLVLAEQECRREN